MKKKILFVITHMGLGGAEKALVSLLNSLDYEKYEVDLQLYSGRGFNLQFIPEEVQVLAPIAENNEYYDRFAKLVKRQLKKGRIGVALRRIVFAGIGVRARNEAETKYYQWRFVRKYIPETSKKYDVAIAFLDGAPQYYVMDKVQAKRKICWVHNDYSKMATCRFDFEYLNRADAVATISPRCVDEIQKFFPQLKNVQLVYNVNSPTLIWKLANASIPEEFVGKEKFRMLCIGRLCEQKAYHHAIVAAKMLKEMHFDFEWNIIGDGELRDALQKQIEAEGVADVFHLLGIKENPYPYIKHSNVIVQCSIYEGKSIALDEAKILCKPIVCTDYNSARDQIQDGVDGIIVPISAEGVAEGVKRMLQSKELRKQLTDHLAKMDFTQRDYLEKYDMIINGVHEK